ncbi:MAG TPA: ATP-binding protein [Ohtaekwangia sp.]|uniref:sensor histidine kinase n=1 Tax=Ohtaekwangia sp. TaxID=2066019 RepID=UPI002F92C029
MFKTKRLIEIILPVILFLTCISSVVNGQGLFIRKYLADEYKGGQNFQAGETKDGTLYFANSEGLLSFDGIEWRMLYLPKHQAIMSFAFDSLDNIYVGAMGEFGYFRKNDSGIYTYTSLMHLIPSEYQEELSVLQVLVAGNGDILLRDYWHTFLYSNGQIKSLNDRLPFGEFLVPVGEEIYRIYGKKLYRYAEGNFTIAPLQVEGDIEIMYIAPYLTGQYLILDMDRKVWILNPAAEAGKRMHLLIDIVAVSKPNIRPSQVTCLSNGLIYVVAEGNLFFFDQNGKKVYHIDEDVLRYIYLNDLFEDSKHNLWIAGNREIVQISTSSPLSYYDDQDGIHHKITALNEDDENLYVGSGWGLYCNPKGTSQFKVIRNADGIVWRIYRFGDKVYAAHQQGVWELHGERVIQVVDELSVMALCKLRNEPDGFIIGTAYDGIWLTTRKPGMWSKHKVKGFANTEARYIEEDNDGYIWLANYNKGINRLRLNEAKDSVIENRYYDSRNGLPSDVNNRVYRIKSLDKVVVTTVNGIYTFNNTTQRFEPYLPINAVLSSNVCIYTVDENATGDIYFWGGLPQMKEFAGLLKKQPDGSYRCITAPFSKIDMPIRDLRVDVDAPVFVPMSGGLFIGNDLRLVHYDPEQKTFFDEPMPVAIKQIWAGDSLIYQAGRKKNIAELPAYMNNIRFHAGSDIYENPERIKYQYKLEGFDERWSDWQSSREAIYTNLPHGDYTFLVRAKDQSERISIPASFSFTIEPPWYRTILAYFLFFALFVFLVYTIVRIYTWGMTEQKLALQRKVSEQNQELLTQNEELFAVNEELASINDEVYRKNEAISEQAKELARLNASKDKLFSIVSHDLRGPVRQVQDILNLIDLNYISEAEMKRLMPQMKDNIRQTLNLTENLLYWAKSQMDGMLMKPLIFDLRSIVEENIHLLAPIAFNKRIKIVSAIYDTIPVYADRDMIQLVLRNLISNAIKFTPHEGAISVKYKRHDLYTEMWVEDTGIGLSAEELAKLLNQEQFTKHGTSGEKGAGIGFGLCREFVEKNGGTITVESELYRGSKFTFTVPNSP